ncbi:CGNR zinc finger domain-containing protein [Streptomyces sp. RS10V-4]|uniref:CGNR zinc finger domain-containing protein n=1 Tax=Streptomyces rhizoryzae TaxID=2932493 RepID=UPI0020036887|nr:CGNR zinc finger domain-containing protein [Streptomyces rhizoryzae]MCK7624857.1 CGNR zinc finger domain-containing protein [Streptomyces rhizoryzae]
MDATQLALDLAVTLRHDGHGGVADDLADTAGLAAWLHDRAAALDCAADGPPPADEALLTAVRELRAAVRALFARAVRPGPPSPADAHRLLPEDTALGRLNAAAARVPTAPRLLWEAGADPVLRDLPAGSPPAADRLTAALARAALTFLAGPDRTRLRACPAPRCVRYFVKDHARQEWCSPSCGNRARVARHHRRHRAAPGGQTG